MDLITNNEKALYARLGIPVRFQDKGFSNYEISTETKKAHKVCEGYAHNFKENLELGAGLILAGAPGTGKTHLAFSILRYVVTKAGTKKKNTDPAFNSLAMGNESNYTAIYSTVFDILKRIKATWGNGSTESEKVALAAYSSPDLLIIDEVGMQHGTDAERVILFEIFDRRYRDMKPTVIIGNLSIQELTIYLGERVIDRMREGGGTAVIFEWDSYRKRSQ